jgi:hypothetical protein
MSMEAAIDRRRTVGGRGRINDVRRKRDAKINAGADQRTSAIISRIVEARFNIDIGMQSFDRHRVADFADRLRRAAPASRGRIALLRDAAKEIPNSKSSRERLQRIDEFRQRAVGRALVLEPSFAVATGEGVNTLPPGDEITILIVRKQVFEER